MKNLLNELIGDIFKDFLPDAVPDKTSIFEVLGTPDPAKGDFALNAAMKCARIFHKSPIDIASNITRQLKSRNDVFKRVEVHPPGFVNLFLDDKFIEKSLIEHSALPTLGLLQGVNPETVLIDYSSVNIAKQMHVGHLRSTIIGDVLSRIMEAQGHRVIRQNHLGDWGLPMAMVLRQSAPVLKKIIDENRDPKSELTLERLESFYRKAAEECKTDPEAAAECHDLLVKLQMGDEKLMELWKTVTKLSMNEVYRLYRELNVKLTSEDECGESFYRNMLNETVQAISKAGFLTESEGAKCVFLENFKGKDGKPLPVMVQKSDGAFNYATFDLAAIRHRIFNLKADRIIYVTDARQALHFSQVFEVAHLCGWTKKNGTTVRLEHVPFGSVLGDDNKPLKTRSGENVKLSQLLAEAVERALAVVCEKNPGLSDVKKRATACAVGIGAVKYADLSQNRNNDYIFSFDKMLALNGNTAPYLQYAHARICSIFRKAGRETDSVNNCFILGHSTERMLALKLLQYPEAVKLVSGDLRPHSLCNYVFELATIFSAFYDQCPVVTENSSTKESRLFLCELTRRTIAGSLDLLGIDSPQEM